MVRITTEKSVKDNNGFHRPFSIAVEDYECNLYLGSTRVEYTVATGISDQINIFEDKP